MSTIKDELYGAIQISNEAKYSSFVEVLDSLDTLNSCAIRLLQYIIDMDTEISDKNRPIFSQLCAKWDPQIKWTLSVSLSVDENGNNQNYFILHLLSAMGDIEKAAYSYMDYLKKILGNSLLRSSDEAVIQHLHALHGLAVDDSFQELADKIEWFIRTDYHVDIIDYNDSTKEYFEESFANGIDNVITTKKAIISKQTKDVICRGVVCKPLNK